jgi:hypothetical protein
MFENLKRRGHLGNQNKGMIILKLISNVELIHLAHDGIESWALMNRMRSRPGA